MIALRKLSDALFVRVCVVSLSLLDDLLQIELGILHLIQVFYGHLQVSLCLSSRFLHLCPDPLLLLPAVLQLHPHTHKHIHKHICTLSRF